MNKIKKNLKDESIEEYEKLYSKWREKFEKQHTKTFDFIIAYLCGDERHPEHEKFQQLNKLKGRKQILDFCKKELLVSKF
jgi:hypothetical protein